mmetsp:Transcript_17358/g.15651  ORF Transcript_17358/g.15651 Transcript_17358/m.15651 type:complete len:160 (-) Transcript_17358:43-522(-)
MNKSHSISFLILLLNLLCYFVIVISIGANPPIEDNLLGIKSRACASSYCQSKDNLDLWFDIEWRCHGQYLQDPVAIPLRRKLLDDDKVVDVTLISRVYVGLICSVSSVLGIIIGYKLGKQYIYKSDNIQYSEIPTTDSIVPVAYSIPEKNINRITYHNH